MDKLKQIWGYVAAGVMAVVGILLYVLQRKNEQIDSLNAKVGLVDTQKEADVIETQIKQAQAKSDNLAKENTELAKTAAALDTKRADVDQKMADMKDPKQVADYWNKQ